MSRYIITKLLLAIGIILLLIFIPYNGVEVNSGIPYKASNEIHIVDGYKSKGELLITSIMVIESKIDGSLLYHLQLKVIKRSKWITDLLNQNTIVDNAEFYISSHEKSKNMAIYNAFKEAGEYIILRNEITLAHDIKDFEYGDILVEFNGITPTKVKEMMGDFVTAWDNKSDMNFTILREGKLYQYNYTYEEYTDENHLALSMFTDTKIAETNKQIISNRIGYGGSAGLITALEIYNQLTPNDITKGYRIAGTGTIEEDGTIGKIAGVEEKLNGAHLAKVDYMLIPKANESEALLYNKYNLNLVIVNTFKEALEFLESL